MKALIIAATAAASLVATAASAQQAAAPQNPGPVIPGVCVYYNARLLAQSAAGQAVETRMQQLAQEVQGELQPYATSLQAEAQQLQTSGASLPAADLQQRRQALQQRAQEAQQLEATRENELRYTLAMQRQAITEAVSPILTALYQERGCGLLLDRESVFMMNPAMDLTDAAIQRLNTALPTLSFNRMAVPAQQSQQPAAAN
ncbi:OmpH family outer membrane protein [Brevundimonas sp.]|jgi:Skp family chaperone for outer membrane proteins|uniref:OmpH family outer membrane protein n=1 Tax=Brevundimonas sp. TaxID=1871086 RepID=UPI0017FEEB04|nr:OmpH family outer membrane protein [Brevundimonas sp.]MBA4806784.1 OmpH family outer membrane protein [Brevundimonas sp.]